MLFSERQATNYYGVKPKSFIEYINYKEQRSKTQKQVLTILTIFPWENNL